MSSMDAHKKLVDRHLKMINEFIRRTGRPFPFMIKIPASRVDILSYLYRIKADRKWYWKSRDHDFEIGGAGSSYIVEKDAPLPFADVQEILENSPDLAPTFIGGKKFAPGNPGDPFWIDFPDETAIIPDAAMIAEGDSFSEVCCRSITANDAECLSIGKLESQFIFGGSKTPTLPDKNFPELVSTEDCPDYNRWCRNVENCLEAIKSRAIRKVVLARRTDYLFKDEIDPFVLLPKLMDNNRHCFAMMYQPRPGTAFISVSPERLYRRRERLLEVEALSSTMPRGADIDEDRRLENELIHSKKLRHEHQVVIDGILGAMATLCQKSPNIGSTTVMKLDRIQHLITPIKGTLREDIHDHSIIEALHPTPAVGGTPREAAIEKIAELENFDRGWYAGPVGCISRERAEFAVGIRSLVVRGNKVSVFTGAGIVAGSDPDAEWKEIESKDVLQAMLDSGRFDDRA